VWHHKTNTTKASPSSAEPATNENFTSPLSGAGRGGYETYKRLRHASTTQLEILNAISEASMDI
jgi:hypothetical protein